MVKSYKNKNGKKTYKNTVTEFKLMDKIRSNI